MYSDVDNAHLTRRDALRHGSLFLGAAALLGGCQSSGTPYTRLPEPVYPDRAPPATHANLNPAPEPVRAAPPVVTGAVAVIPRSRWTSTQPLQMRETYMMNGVSRITVHHDAIPSSGISSTDDAMRRLNAVRNGHLQRNMIDIGYHYVVDPSGRVWEARPVRYQGGHVHDQNEHNLGIMVMGNFDQQAPSRQSIAALDAFVAQQMHRFRIPIQRVYTHQEIGKSRCPGTNMQAHMIKTRSRGGQLLAMA